MLTSAYEREMDFFIGSESFSSSRGLHCRVHSAFSPLTSTKGGVSLTLVDLAEDNDTWKSGIGIVRDARVEDEDSHVTASLGRDIFVGLLDQHVVVA